jgi:flagellar motility protein MotE (MotC chaperone)
MKPFHTKNIVELKMNAFNPPFKSLVQLSLCSLCFISLAFAQEPTPPPSVPASVNPAEPVKEPAVATSTDEPKADRPGRVAPSDDNDIRDQLRIFKSAAEQKRKIKQAKEENERRMERLILLKKEVEGKYKALRMLQEELTTTIQQQRNAEGESDESNNSVEAKAERIAQISQVAKIFDKAKPASAAKIAEEMDEALVVDVLRKIKAAQAAKILNNIKPEIAAKITARMASKK